MFKYVSTGVKIVVYLAALIMVLSLAVYLLGSTRGEDPAGSGVEPAAAEAKAALFAGSTLELTLRQSPGKAIAVAAHSVEPSCPQYTDRLQPSGDCSLFRAAVPMSGIVAQYGDPLINEEPLALVDISDLSKWLYVDIVGILQACRNSRAIVGSSVAGIVFYRDGKDLVFSGQITGGADNWLETARVIQGRVSVLVDPGLYNHLGSDPTFAEYCRRPEVADIQAGPR